MPGLGLNWSLVGHSHKFCAIIAPTHLVGRTDCRWKVLWLGWCPSPTTESLVWLQKMDGSGSILITRCPCYGHPLDSREFPPFLCHLPISDTLWSNNQVFRILKKFRRKKPIVYRGNSKNSRLFKQKSNEVTPSTTALPVSSICEESKSLTINLGIQGPLMLCSSTHKHNSLVRNL